jgi:hypothetical protein
VNVLKGTNSKHPLRRQIENLLEEEVISKLKLDLPVCQNCKTPRIDEYQKFCHICGTELINQSTYESCMKISIQDLPLPIWQRERIGEFTNLKTIQDILSIQDPASELRKAPMIGQQRSKKILEDTFSFVQDFLM